MHTKAPTGQSVTAAATAAAALSGPADRRRCARVPAHRVPCHSRSHEQRRRVFINNRQPSTSAKAQVNVIAAMVHDVDLAVSKRNEIDGSRTMRPRCASSSPALSQQCRCMCAATPMKRQALTACVAYCALSG